MSLAKMTKSASEINLFCSGGGTGSRFKRHSVCVQIVVNEDGEQILPNVVRLLAGMQSNSERFRAVLCDGLFFQRYGSD